MTQKPTVPPKTAQNNPTATKDETLNQGKDIGTLDRQSRRQAQAVQKNLDENSKSTVRLFQILLFLIAIQITYWIWGVWRERQVKATEPIGTLQSMTAGSGWRGGSVIEVRKTLENASTEIRFYPLDGAMAATKGTPLILETRANDALFICDAQRHTCARTAPDMLHGASPVTVARP